MKTTLPFVHLMALTVVALLVLSFAACGKKKEAPGAMPKDPCQASVDRMIKCTRENNPKFAEKMAEKRKTMLDLCASNELSNKKAKKCARIRGCTKFMKCLDEDL